MAAALARRTLAYCQLYVRNLLKADRDKQWQDIVMQAAHAAENNDMRSLYQMVRRLSIYRPRAIPAIRRKDGTLADCPEASDGRWLEHFADLFMGPLMMPVSRMLVLLLLWLLMTMNAKMILAMAMLAQLSNLHVHVIAISNIPSMLSHLGAPSTWCSRDSIR